ncbi:MAG: cytochrome c biogenesis protein CcdA [Gammaproteobacteria bacterium]|nr:cytochrome c biogenesis protein CcdA [Gammaproteobacteria bacterium]
MSGFDISYAGALVAGLLSFASPCVLPLVPPYLCFLGGVTMEQLIDSGAAQASGARRVWVTAIAFVLGFASVFIALGATATTLGKVVGEHLNIMSYIAGIVIIALGLHFLGVFRIGMLYREARFHIGQRPAGVVGAYVVGLAFAFGWTPCVGPVLAAILFVAASEDSALYGAILLAVYAAGIGIPFLVAALAAGPFMAFVKRFRQHLNRVEQVMGVLLVATGILFLTGSMADMAYWLLETFPGLGAVG